MRPRHIKHLKHTLHKHPVKPTKFTEHTLFSSHLEQDHDVELAYHPFDLPVKGWWSNHWIPNQDTIS